VQQQQARLRRDQHSHFIGDFLPATAFEPFLREEYMNVSLQFSTSSGGRREYME